ncbi:hypothetical protein BGZ94_000970 [Podila epigama]|nr:hypothetical protein BGZ94_000970 [Podila epigama]
MASVPPYTGITDFLPESLDAAAYFKSTKVAFWSLHGFLTATGRDEKAFLSEILDISKFKLVPLDVRLFAKDLYSFYTGVFGENVKAFAKDQAQSSVNRLVFRGKEQLITQKRYKDDLDNDLRFQRLDSSKFWRLATGTCVEETLFQASLAINATTKYQLKQLRLYMFQIQ